MQLVNLGTGVGYLKGGFMGFAGSGKTFTAKELAIGVKEHFNLDGPIAMFDTEGGAQYIARDIANRTGKDLVGVQSRALADAIEFIRHCETSGVSVAIIDSVTHLWREVCDTYLTEVNKKRSAMNPPRSPRIRLEFQDWNEIKKRWEPFTTAYLNSKLHLIICGRAGFEYDFQDVNDDGTKKELVKTGIKMKSESEMGYEPSLLVLMERVQLDDDGKLQYKITHRATVLKERFGVLDGKECDNPGYDFFKPFVALLSPGAHVAVDTDRTTPMHVDESGDGEWSREKKLRAIFAEEIQGLLVATWPSQSAAEKGLKTEAIFRAFGTRSWTAVESTDSTRLKAGLDAMPGIIAGLQAPAQAPPIDGAKAVVEHFTKDAPAPAAEEPKKAKNGGKKAEPAGKGK